MKPFCMCPVYKEGNIDDLNNFRGINKSTGQNFHKILNNRLVNWAEKTGSILKTKHVTFPVERLFRCLSDILFKFNNNTEIFK